MELPVNHFKRALRAGRPQVGLWSLLSSHLSVEIVAGAGFDWLVLDTEHAPNELPMVLSQLQATTGGTAHPIVRIPWNDTVDFKRYLDIGAQTILVPYIETAEQAASAVAAMRYPPRGVRGFSGNPRAASFGRIKDYWQHCEEELCLLLQVETRLGLQNLEAIATTDGVDGIFIGPGDLSAALGHLANPGHPDVLTVIEETIARIRACGQPAGILTSDDALIRRYLELGCTFVAVGTDVGILSRGSEQLAGRYKA